MVSIIIVHYHVKKELFMAIQAIIDAKPKKKYEIIVVDNDEQKTLQPDLKKYFPDVVYIPNENKGFGQGNNVGAKHAKGEYLFFLNPDTKMYPSCIDLLINYLESHPKTGIVAPLLYDQAEKLVPLQGARELTPLSAIFSFSFINKFFPKNPIKKKYWYLDEWDKESIKEVDSVPGTAFIIRQKLYEKLQGFDEHFFLYFEEHDLCRRAKKLGWKLIIIPQAKVSHVLGSSTKKLKQDVNKIFKASRFYYLKKHFGMFAALMTETVLRMNKYTFLLTAIILLGIFLRVFNISQTMPFIGDQGWFYLSARDMLLTGRIPLVGIESSHPWLHQGAVWTYLVALSFWMFGFNPVVPAYVTITLDICALYLFYKIGSTLFSQRVGLLAASLYATSPLVVFNARMPYHTSPIPLLSMLFFFFLYKWINGKVGYFPVVILLLAILYSFELATFIFSFITFGVLFFGWMKKYAWARDVLRPKIMLLSFGAFIIAMLPMLVYDVSHSFSQTLKFLAWIGYRILVLFGYPVINPISPISLHTMLTYFKDYYQQVILPGNHFIALAIFAVSTVLVLKKVLVEKEKNLILLCVVGALLIVGVLVAKTPSGAYLPMLFPSTLLFTAIFLDGLLTNKFLKYFACGLVLVLVACNSYFLVVHSYASSDITGGFPKKLEVVNYIVKESDGKEYNLKGRSVNSQFESFTMNYEYLAWWLGHGPSKAKQRLQFIISEEANKIKVLKHYD